MTFVTPNALYNIILDFFRFLCYPNIKGNLQEVLKVKIQESAEMYLETILILSKKSAHVRSIDICEHMGFSKPSVSRAVSLLKNGGYVIADKDGYLSLTDEGREIAEKIYERHNILTVLLTRLGVSEQIASQDACKLEHVLSDESMDAIKRFISSK